MYGQTLNKISAWSLVDNKISHLNDFCKTCIRIQKYHKKLFKIKGNLLKNICEGISFLVRVCASSMKLFHRRFSWILLSTCERLLKIWWFRLNNYPRGRSAVSKLFFKRAAHHIIKQIWRKSFEQIIIFFLYFDQHFFWKIPWKVLFKIGALQISPKFLDNTWEKVQFLVQLKAVGYKMIIKCGFMNRKACKETLLKKF